MADHSLTYISRTQFAPERITVDAVGDAVFDLIAQAIAAWNQVGLLIVSGFLGGLGAWVLGNRIYWRMGAVRVSGTVIGVRKTAKDTYYPVYRYVSPTGDTIEATSSIGSSVTSRMQTGRKVRLLVFDGYPDKATDADSYVAEIMAAAFIILAL
jgi:hypothetical protein